MRICGALAPTECQLDIPESLANGFLYLVEDDKAEKTPYKNKEHGSIGAHVSVISDSEIDEDIKIDEVGEYFDFTISGVKKLKPDGWAEMDQVYIVEIDSPYLKDLRQRYGLPKTYHGKGHNFHITFALEKA